MGIEFAGFDIEAIDPNYKESHDSKEYIICEITLPFRIPLTKKDFVINIDNELIQMEIETIWSGSIIADNHIFDFDRYGQVSKTKIRTKIKKDNECGIVVTKSVGIIYLKKTIKAINKLLDACALFSKFYCNRKIGKDILEFTIVCEDKVAVMANPLSQETGTSFRIFSQEENIDKFMEFLTKDLSIALHDELITNAKDFILVENYRMACIEIQSAVEFSMINYLKIMLSRKKTPQSDMDIILKDRLDEWKKEITKIDNSITSGNTWREWNEYCYKTRNKIIHRSYIPDEQETIRSIDTGEKLIRLFNQMIL